MRACQPDIGEQERRHSGSSPRLLVPRTSRVGSMCQANPSWRGVFFRNSRVAIYRLPLVSEIINPRLDVGYRAVRQGREAIVTP